MLLSKTLNSLDITLLGNKKKSPHHQHPLEESEIFFLEDTADPDELTSVAAVALGREKIIFLIHSGKETNHTCWKFLQYQSERRKTVYHIPDIKKHAEWLDYVLNIIHQIQQTRPSIKFTLRMTMLLYDQIHRASRQGKITKADLVRDAITKYLADQTED